MLKFSGRYEVNNASISFSELSVTLMSGSRSAMNFEERFLRILRSAKKVRHDKDTLILENTKGDTLTFRKLRTSGKHENESAPLNR